MKEKFQERFRQEFQDEFKSNLYIIIPMVILALCIYAVHYAIFGQIKSTVSGLILSLAYVPIGVLYNFLVVKKVQKKSEQIKLERRMNIILGSFYQEIGNDTMYLIADGDGNKNQLSYLCNASVDWDKDDFRKLSEIIQDYECKIDIENLDLEELKQTLIKNEGFLLDLMINSNLDGYEGFDSMVMAILHLRDEFKSLYVNGKIEDRDKEHMTKDICKAYKLLMKFRVNYLKNLKEYYPLMFIKIIERSPFRESCNKR